MNKDSNLSVLTISVAAQLVGISIHTIRMYEREGLILPYKVSGKQRRYSVNDVERMQYIRHIINHEKMSIEGIRRMLALIPC
jgi:MerR family transcriptional regulator, heat shock protein HspR